MRLSTSQYAKLLLSLSEDDTDPERRATAFLSFVRANRSMGRIREIMRAFDRMADEHEGKQEVLVETAMEPGGTFKEDVEKIAAELFADRRLSFRFSVRPELIGGARISSDNEMVDASIGRRLQELKARIRQIES